MLLSMKNRLHGSCNTCFAVFISCMKAVVRQSSSLKKTTKMNRTTKKHVQVKPSRSLFVKMSSVNSVVLCRPLLLIILVRRQVRGIQETTGTFFCLGQTQQHWEDKEHRACYVGYFFYNACNTCCKCRCFLNIYHHPNCNLFENLTKKPQKSFSISSCSERLKLPGKNSHAHPLDMRHLCNVSDYIKWLPRFWQSKAWWTKNTIRSTAWSFGFHVRFGTNSIPKILQHTLPWNNLMLGKPQTETRAQSEFNLFFPFGPSCFRLWFEDTAWVWGHVGTWCQHARVKKIDVMWGKWFGKRRCYTKLEDPPANYSAP